MINKQENLVLRSLRSKVGGGGEEEGGRKNKMTADVGK